MKKNHLIDVDIFTGLKNNLDYFQKNGSCLADVYDHEGNLISSKYYTEYFNKIPNYIEERSINCAKALKWLIEEYKLLIDDYSFTKPYFNPTKRSFIDDVFLILNADIMVKFDFAHGIVMIFYKNSDYKTIKEISEGIIKCRKIAKRASSIYLLCKNQNAFEFKLAKIKKSSLSISENYNEDFNGINQVILKRLNKLNDKGIVLLHGKPGTGKTSYIRYLIKKLRKDVIFLSPNIAEHITNPDLITILIDSPNSIFVIEDAENIVIDRGYDSNSAVSTLLNLSDGLLSDCLKIQIICSFNIDISKVDSALMRKGRLIAMYEFKELEMEKAQMLSDKIGFKTLISKPMTLTEIYNQEELSFQNFKMQPIGFN